MKSNNYKKQGGLKGANTFRLTLAAASLPLVLVGCGFLAGAGVGSHQLFDVGGLGGEATDPSTPAVPRGIDVASRPLLSLAGLVRTGLLAAGFIGPLTAAGLTGLFGAVTLAGLLATLVRAGLLATAGLDRLGLKPPPSTAQFEVAAPCAELTSVWAAEPSAAPLSPSALTDVLASAA